MQETRFSRLAFVGRIALLFLLAGHLLLRQAFAHISLTDIIQFAGHPGLPLNPIQRPAWTPAVFDSAYITELALLCLLPLAVYLLFKRSEHRNEAAAGREEDAQRTGIGFYFAYALLFWGALQALLAAVLLPRQLPDLPPGIAPHPAPDGYLILRQSAVVCYVLFFVYTVLFFRARQRYVTQAVLCGVTIAIGCALADLAGWLGPPSTADTFFGQETLPLAILTAIFVIATMDNLFIQAIALAVLGLAGWRQSLRFQSSVAVSLMAALGLYFLLGLSVVPRGQARTVQRGAACLAIVVVLAAVVYYRSNSSPAMAEKLAALSPKTYTMLLDNYELGRPPAKHSERMTSNREPYVAVSDPEVYHLEAVYDTSRSVSIADNIWRILVWRRMASEWRERNPIAGAGVGQPWFYEALYHTKFYYGEKREGLEPHNSYLNMLYRYGLIGFLIFAALVASVLFAAWKALRTRIHTGDPLLEGIALYFFYTAVFAVFNNALEGPSYALPFWFSLGLLYARARQLLVKAQPEDL